MEPNWHKTGIQLPPGWHEAVATRAHDIGLPIRYLYMVAVDHVLGMEVEAVKRIGREFRDLGDDDFAGLVARNAAAPAVAPPPAPRVAPAPPELPRARVAGG